VKLKEKNERRIPFLKWKKKRSGTSPRRKWRRRKCDSLCWFWAVARRKKKKKNAIISSRWIKRAGERGKRKREQTIRCPPPQSFRGKGKGKGVFSLSMFAEGRKGYRKKGAVTFGRFLCVMSDERGGGKKGGNTSPAMSVQGSPDLRGEEKRGVS